MVQLRDYQTQAIEDLRSALRAGKRRALLVSPTGSGKTTVAAELLRGAQAKGTPTLFLAHRTELITQASRRLDAFGLDHGIIKAGNKRVKDSALMQVASVQTLVRRKEKPPAKLIVVDEAHRTLGETYLRILEAYPDAAVIGLTATPIRFDGRGLGDVFAALVEAAKVEDLVERGVLVKPRVFAPVSPDLTGVRTVAGDYSRLQLAGAMNKPKLVGDIVEQWGKRAAGRRTVVFASSVEHSRSICEAFQAAGVAAEHIDGATSETEREGALVRLEVGETTVVCNFGVLTEGWDCPACEVVVLARPTKSLALYLQMVGRVLRPHPGKQEAIVLDHAGCTYLHGFATMPRTWALSNDRKEKEETPPPSLRTCLDCYAVALASSLACPDCGAAWPKDEAITPVKRKGARVRAGDLRELTEEQVFLRGQPIKTVAQWRRQFPTLRGRGAPLEDQRAFFAALVEYGKSRGHKPGWAWKMFSLVAGFNPSREVMSAGAAPEERNRSRRLKDDWRCNALEMGVYGIA